MLFAPQAGKLVEESLEVATSAAERDRQREMLERLCIWRDGHLDLLVRRAFQIWDPRMASELQPLLQRYPNPLKQIVERLSRVYSWRARRWIEGDPAMNQRYQALLRSLPFDLDEKMATANRMVNLMNEVLLFYAVNRRTGKPRLDVLTPDRFSAMAHPDEPGEPVSIVYTRWNPKTLQRPFRWSRHVASQQAFGAANIQRVYWDADGYRIHGTDGVLVEEGENSLRDRNGAGVLPFIAVHRTDPMELLLDDASGQDLVDATLDVGVLAAGMMRLAQWQAELQLVESGPSSRPVRRHRLGASSVYRVAEGCTLTVLNLQADPMHYLTQIKARVAWIAAAYGIAPDAMDVSWLPSSGVELRLRERPLMEKRLEQVPRWLHAEKRFFGLLALTHPEQELDPAAQLAVDWGEEPLIVDPQARLTLEIEEVKAGLTSIEAVIMGRNPDLSFAQAAEQVRTNIESRNRWITALREGNMPADPRDLLQLPEDNGAAGRAVQTAPASPGGDASA